MHISRPRFVAFCLACAPTLGCAKVGDDEGRSGLLYHGYPVEDVVK